MKTFLKVKCRSLRAEIRVIDRELKRWGSRPITKQLSEHRAILAPALVGAELAYLFLRRKPWPRTYFPIIGSAENPTWELVTYNVQRFAGGFKNGKAIDQQEAIKGFAEWFEAAQLLDSNAECIKRRQARDERSRQRRFNYHIKYLTGQKGQAELKARLKAKWGERQAQGFSWSGSSMEQGGISDRLSNFDDYGNRIRDPD